MDFGLFRVNWGIYESLKEKQFLFANLKRQSSISLPFGEDFCNHGGYKTEVVKFILPFKKASKAILKRFHALDLLLNVCLPHGRTI